MPLDSSSYATADRVRAIRGGRARHGPHSRESVASSGKPQVAQPLSPRNSICFQQSEQKLCASLMIVPQPAHLAGSAKSSTCFRAVRISTSTHTQSLSRVPDRRTSGHVELFDHHLRRLRRDRAFRRGPELFLHERAFADVLERLSIVRRRFRSALLIGCLDPGWHDRLLERVDTVDVIDPGPLLADAGTGTCASEEQLDVQPGSYDLCVAVGTLDTVNDLPGALLRIRFSLQEDSLFIGAFAGGDSLPRLRAAMRAADQQMGGASPHMHPRVEPAAFSTLLEAAGFTMPVVDLDRIQVSYKSLWDLVRDLRAMGATNVLASRSRRPLTRAAASAAADHFRSEAPGEPVIECFELLHFAAWTPAAPPAAQG
jgi:NADH dehydrogenase [ubiquinone] 1 alpha subcomplex assembly factor 5